VRAQDDGAAPRERGRRARGRRPGGRGAEAGVVPAARQDRGRDAPPPGGGRERARSDPRRRRDRRIVRASSGGVRHRHHARGDEGGHRGTRRIPMKISESLFEFTLLGAEWVLWLLLLLSVASVAVMIERALFFYRRRVDPDRL